MPILESGIEVPIVLFAAWTVSYHLVFVAQWQAGLITIPFAFMACAAFAVFRKRWARACTSTRNDFRLLAAIVLLGLLYGLATLLFSEANNDDISFFHRALVQQCDTPILRMHTSDDVGNLPPLSILHLMTSFEPLVALSARLLHLDPVKAYQIFLPFLFAASIPATLYLLCCRLRLRRFPSLLSGVVALAFLFLDGGQRAVGIVALTALRSGKVIVWVVLLPVALFLTVRYLMRPNRLNLVFVSLAVVCGVGLSNSGIYLVPMSVFATTVAYAALSLRKPRRLKRAVVANASSVYGVLIGAATVGGLLPMPADRSVWTQGWPSDWWSNLALVFQTRGQLLRDALILTAIPATTLRRPLGLLVVGVSAALCVLYANPLAGPWWMKILQPGSYWRVAFLFPLLPCVGFLGACFLPTRRASRRYAQIAVGVLSVCVLFVTRKTLSPSFPSKLTEYRLRPGELAFARAHGDELETRVVLTSEDMACTLGLVHPSMKFVVVRPTETRHIFKNAGRAAEGELRAAAQALVASGERSETNDRAFMHVVTGISSAVIVPSDHEAPIQALLQQTGSWHRVGETSGYVLYERES
jgi:hypothetical protein